MSSERRSVGALLRSIGVKPFVVSRDGSWASAKVQRWAGGSRKAGSPFVGTTSKESGARCCDEGLSPDEDVGAS